MSYYTYDNFPTPTYACPTRSITTVTHTVTVTALPPPEPPSPADNLNLVVNVWDVIQVALTTVVLFKYQYFSRCPSDERLKKLKGIISYWRDDFLTPQQRVRIQNEDPQLLVDMDDLLIRYDGYIEGLGDYLQTAGTFEQYYPRSQLASQFAAVEKSVMSMHVDFKASTRSYRTSDGAFPQNMTYTPLSGRGHTYSSAVPDHAQAVHTSLQRRGSVSAQGPILPVADPNSLARTAGAAKERWLKLRQHVNMGRIRNPTLRNAAQMVDNYLAGMFTN